MAFHGIQTCRSCSNFITSRKQLSLTLHKTWLLHQQLQSSARLSLQLSTDSKRVNSTSKDEDEENTDAPYSYSKSKAAHWTVEKSFGAQYKRPWWKVAPVSLALFALVAWIFLRSETDLDRQLEVKLSERLPDLFPPSENESGETDDAVALKDAS